MCGYPGISVFRPSGMDDEYIFEVQLLPPNSMLKFHSFIYQMSQNTQKAFICGCIKTHNKGIGQT